VRFKNRSAGLTLGTNGPNTNKKPVNLRSFPY
jgi:hypothetical protein